MLACRKDGDLFVATGLRRTIRREGESSVDGLATLAGLEACRVETRLRGNGVGSPTVGCRGTMACRIDGRHMKVLVDIADNTILAWHDPSAAAAARK